MNKTIHNLNKINLADLTMNTQHLLNTSKKILISELNHILTNNKTPCPKLHEAIKYSLLNQGKCIRSALVYYTGLMLDANLTLLKKAMLSVELIHTYSLIHDDLPAMDNSNLRRGMPTSHIKFDEATAILAGDALQTLAFEQLSEPNMNPKSQLKMINLLAQSIGINGMIGGQSLDINNNVKTKEDLDKLHNLKTGALITTSILLGAFANDQNINNKETIDSLIKYGNAIGLAFQIVDDVLDIEQSTEILGKPQNLDKSKEIPTYPDIMGSIKLAKKEAEKLINSANNELNVLGNNLNISKEKVLPLQIIALYILNRVN